MFQGKVQMDCSWSSCNNSLCNSHFAVFPSQTFWYTTICWRIWQRSSSYKWNIVFWNWSVRYIIFYIIFKSSWSLFLTFSKKDAKLGWKILLLYQNYHTSLWYLNFNIQLDTSKYILLYYFLNVFNYELTKMFSTIYPHSLIFLTLHINLPT